MISMLVLGVMTGLIGSLYGAKPVLAQDMPSGPPKASEVVDRETLKNFVEGAKTHIEGIYEAGEALAPFLNSTRDEGDWKHGNTFLMLMLLDGTVLFHAGDVTASGKSLFELEDDTGKTVVRDLIETGRLGGGHVDYTWDDPNDDEDDPAKVAYATSFFGNNYGNQVILVGGYYQDVSQIEPPVYDASLIPEPEVTAAEVMDRETLQQFVIGAMRGYIGALQEHGTDRYNEILNVFRIEDGHWRHGSIYLFILNDQGYVIFHGADRTQEARNQSHLEDINGVRFVQEFIRVAKAGGGFVEYQYDDPSVPGDEVTGTPKLSYVQSFEARSGRRVIFGAGIYFDPADYDRETKLAVDPSVLTEGGGPQTVTVTATQTGDPLPVTTRLSLTLSGTATDDDYAVTGDMYILIPPGGSEGTTELTFTVEDDGVEEPDGETIVVTAGYNMEELATAEIAVKDVTTPTAGEVVDRETLATFVEGAKTHIEGIYESGGALAPFLNSTREEGDWKHGNTFLMLMLLDGTVLFHAGDISASGKSLFELEDDTGKTVVRDLIETGRLGGGHVDYTWDDPNDDDDPAKVAYATSFFGKNYGNQVILVGGFYMDVSQIEPPVYDASLIPEPEVTAAEVMDRETLQQFVIGAMRGYIGALQEHGTDRYADILNVFRIEDGHWRHGSIYLFILNDLGYVIFHGADRTQEARNQSHLEDINGVRFVQEFIRVATAGGGFVEYQYDDPSVPGDEVTGTPKLSFVQSVESRGGRRVIFGAGIYFDPADYDRETMLAVDPSVLSEGGGPQTVTVTATQTGDLIPVTTRLSLDLSGTATGDDYSVTGDMHILIPPEGSMGTTELTFTVVNDGVEEAGGETIVVSAGYDMEELATAEIAVNDLRPVPAGEVVDRETLKGFVEMVADSLERVTDANDFPALAISFRTPGDWKHGDLYLSVLTVSGEMFFHGDNPTRDGIDISELEDDSGEKVVQKILAAAGSGGGFVEFTWDDPNDPGDDPNRLAYATRYASGFGVGEFVLVGGFNMDIPDPDAESTLPNPPEVQAQDVVDKETLKAFVQGSIKWSFDAFETYGVEAGVLTSAWREEGGPFREGAIYLFILTTEGFVFFHGADATQEGAIRIDLEDLNGKRFVEDLINVAVAGGGFVEYHYDDPSVEGDEELGSPKVSYAETIEYPDFFPGQTFVIGAGFYRRPVDDIPEITLEVDRESLAEGLDAQEVVVTATLTDDPVPAATIIDLTLSGTATGDDYTSEGTLEIIIPGDATSASTTLTFNVIDDGVDEDVETIEVKADYEGNDLSTATITVIDAADFTTADEVVDRETLRSFVGGFVDYLATVDTVDKAARLLSDVRSEGIWRVPGEMYFIFLQPDGSVFLHADDPTRDGIDASDLEDDNGEKVIQKILETAAAGGGFVDYTWDDPDVPDDDPARVAYAVNVTSNLTGRDWVVVSGFNQFIPRGDELELPGPPEVWARDVVDRETLKAFVQGAIRWYEEAIALIGDDLGKLALVRDITRVEGGPFREGAVYMFTMTSQGYVLFHGADVTQEGAVQIHLEDLNGVRFVEEIIKAGLRGGDFIEYHYDDPSVEGDEELGSPKVSYAEAYTLPPDSPLFPNATLVTGAGFYRRPVDDVPEITLTVEPETVIEGRGGQEVTVTATLTEEPITAATIIGLTLGGTATSDDYTAEGTLEIIIPRDAVSASRTLTFDVAYDGMDEAGETIVVTADYEGQEIGTATISVQDALVPPLPVGDVTAADVMDRATLKTFVQAATSAYKGAIDEVGFGNHEDVVEAFRIEDGIWRLGEIYIFFLQTDGLLLFHGATPSREDVNIFDAQDLNGVYYVRELIQAAQAGGGYVEYYFDNPAVVGDEELGSPKVSYAETVVVDGMELVIGSGFYFDFTGYTPGITLSVNPATVSEEGGAQIVTVTAAQTSMAIPISTVLPLALSGTATGDDYSVSGDLSITIPGERTEGSTQLTLTVVNDDVYESGGETIIVSASFDSQELDTATVTVTDSYDAPSTVGSPPSVTLEAGDSRTANLESVFTGTDLSYSAATSDNGVAEAAMTGATLTVTGVRKGSATVTVAARNAAGTATVEVGVTVTAIAAERMAYENILGAMGRNMLSSVSTTIGGRFAAGTGGQRITVGGRRIDGIASSVSALASLTGHGRQAQEKHLALLNDAGHPRGVGGDYLLRTSSFVYAPEDQMATGGVQWTVWGAGDLRNFQGEPDVDASYDGSLKAAYLGFDVAVQRNWLAGIALSHATGQSDYDVTVASGTLESRLTSVLPYVRWLCSTGLSEAWSIVGLGTGEVESEDATSDLSMRMALVGIRTRLAGTGGTGLDVVGDAGLARLSTSDSESASLGDINANAQRVRIGLEGSRSTKLSGGTTLTPYAQLAGRYDGGTGQTGQGLEVSGGLRLSGGRVGINAQGRFLAVHTAEGYSENGFSLVASLSPGAGGTGLSMSVAPRVGAGTGDSGMMWRDRPLAGSSLHGRNNARALRAEVGYGLAYPSMGVLMTPFGEMYLLGDDRRQMRLGARLAPSGADFGGASMELSGMRIDRRGGASDHRIGLLARMSF